MTLEKKGIPFALEGINTEQFAVLKDKYREDCDIKLEIEVPFRGDDEEHFISSIVRIHFTCENNPFIILEVICHFKIEPETFEKQLLKKNGIKIPVGFARHLAMLTLGTARGILHEKLKSYDAFKTFVIPTIDLTKIIDDDIVLKKGNHNPAG